MAKRPERHEDRAVYIISVAAELAGVHPQTLRIYERKGLLTPSRTAGNTRRYSERDIATMQTIQRLTQEHGINLAGVKMIVEKENELERMRRRMEHLSRELERARERLRDEPQATPDASRREEILPVSMLKRLAVKLSAQAPPPSGGSRGPIPVGGVKEQ